MCVVAVNGRSKLLVVRGLTDGLRGKILLDEISRNELKIDNQSSQHFTITQVGPVGQIFWVCRSADADVRVAGWLAVWSFIVGLLGIGFSVWTVLPR